MPIPVDLDTPEEKERKMWEQAAPGVVGDPIYAQISREAYQRASRTPGWNGIVLDAVGYMAMLMSKGADADKAKRNFDASIMIRGKKAPPDLAEKALAGVEARYKQLGGTRQAASSPAALLRDMAKALAAHKKHPSQREIVTLQTLGGEVEQHWASTPAQRKEANRMIAEALAGGKKAAGTPNQTGVRRWMTTNWRQYVDRNTGEGGATELAEAAAYEFDHPDWLDDSNHWVWDLAAEVMDKQAPQRLAGDRAALIQKAASMPRNSPQRRWLLAFLTNSK